MIVFFGIVESVGYGVRVVLGLQILFKIVPENLVSIILSANSNVLRTSQG
jgi:hypothetical protein